MAAHFFHDFHASSHGLLLTIKKKFAAVVVEKEH